MSKIILYLNGAPPRDIALDKERISIGRRKGNDIVIHDPAVSGEHAVIVSAGRDPYLEDLNSTNGTMVNGQPIRKHFLRSGDVIELALHRMLYVADSV
jgi:pSer/pThr/pTyr-binding forkhead associated (FHA) protein